MFHEVQFSVVYARVFVNFKFANKLEVLITALPKTAFFKTFNLLLGERAVVTISFSCFPLRRVTSSFQILKLKLLITFNLMSVVSFKGHI